MNQSKPLDPRQADFLKEAEKVQLNIGRKPLSDEDLIILACEEISRTCTNEEKRYNA